MTTYHRVCLSSPTKKCPRKPECQLDCHFDTAEQEENHPDWNQGRGGRNKLPIQMLSKTFDPLKDFFNTVIWWSGTIALIVLVAVAAGFAFGFLGG